MHILSVMAVVIDFTELSAIYERGKTALKSGTAKVKIVVPNLSYSCMQDTSDWNKVEESIRAGSFADIPTACFLGIKRQKPRNAARMSETTLFGLILTIVYE